MSKYSTKMISTKGYIYIHETHIGYVSWVDKKII